MGRPCTACGHTDRAAIDRRILAGDPLAEIAHDFGLHRNAVRRHRAHVERNFAALRAATDIDPDATPPDVPADPGTFAQQLDGLIDRAASVQEIGRAGGDGRLALAAIKERRALIETKARLAANAGGGQDGEVAGRVVVCLPHNFRDPIPPGMAASEADYARMAAEHEEAWKPRLPDPGGDADR